MKKIDKRPLRSWRVNNHGSFIEVSVWANEVKLENKDRVELHAVSMQRSFKTGDEWQNTQVMRPQDLLVLAHLLTQAYTFIIEQ